MNVADFVPTTASLAHIDPNKPWQVDALEGRLHAAPVAAGFDAILMPGELEWRSRSQRAAEGIPIPAATLRATNDLAQELGLSPI
jgi:LDH2 family malate/lactate/ureidoglycolate dehydrogenase